MLGVGTAVWSTGSINPVYAMLALLGALSAHICVNSFNEYFDFCSELDFRTVRTALSGGSGVLPSQPQLINAALAVAMISFIITTLIGLFFLSVRGMSLLPLGVLGLTVIFGYTRYLTHNSLLCLLAPGLGFGPLMILGTDFVLTGQYSQTACVAALIPFFLVNNLLLLNQFPDVEADRSVGRRNFPIVIGKHASCHIYSAFIMLAFLSIPLGVSLACLPATSLIALSGLLIAIPSMIGVYRHTEVVRELIPFMQLNVAVTICTPVLVTLALLTA